MAFSFQARGFQRASSPEAPSQEAAHRPCTHSGRWWGRGWGSDPEDPSQAPPLGWGTPAPTPDIWVAVSHGACLAQGGAGRQAGSPEPTAEGAGGAARRPVHCGPVVRAWAREGPSAGRTLDTLAGGLCSQVPSCVHWGTSTSSLCPELPPAPRGPRVHFSDSQSLPRTYPLGRGTGSWLCLRVPGCSPPCGHLSAGQWQGGGPGAEHPGPADEPQAWEKGQLVVWGQRGEA